MSDPACANANAEQGISALPDRRGAVDLHFLHRGHGLEFEMEARWIRSQLPRICKRIADVGCGNGGLFPWIGAEKVVGFDFAPEGLRYTREKFSRASLVASCAEHLPVAARSFDAIVMQHVIEHLHDAEGGARGWYRALQKGGRLVIVTPNADFVDPSVYNDPTHTHIFTRQELRALVESAGFEVCDIRTLGLPYFRDHARFPGGWRLRRGVIRGARLLARIPGFCGAGQSLCCAARRPR